MIVLSATLRCIIVQVLYINILAVLHTPLLMTPEMWLSKAYDKDM